LETWTQADATGSRKGGLSGILAAKKRHSQRLAKLMKFSREVQLYATAQAVLLAFCMVSAVAAPVDPAQMQKMIAKSKELGEFQRKFEELGAAKPSTIKSKEDADNRIAVLDQLIRATNEQSKMIRQNGGSAQDAEVFANLQGMQKRSREQLLFLRDHFGKWKVGDDGEVEYTVPKAELDAFNKSLYEFNEIRIKQLELLRARAEARKKLQQNSPLRED